MFSFHVLFISVSNLLLCIIVSSEDVIINIKDGSLLGESRNTFAGRPFNAFTKIPFAKAPIGELRFQLPQPPEPWYNVRNATEPIPMCIQNLGSDDSDMYIKGEEDCLYLEVYMPKHISKPLPVMVFIHGGSLKQGSASYFSPIYFMDFDIVVVNIQYRLNVFGFLSTNDDVIPGNLGMKDQVAALKWVKNNIAAFGGDPNLVTLFGSSAGATSVHFHSFSPLSKGLFHRIILQSGSAFVPNLYSNAEDVRRKTISFAELFYCPTESSQKIMQCLQAIPAELLVRKHENMFMWAFEPLAFFTIVGEFKSENAFITEIPQFSTCDVPMIAGVNNREGIYKLASLMINNGEIFSLMKKILRRILPGVLNYSWHKDDQKFSEIAESLQKYYFQDNEFSSGTIEEFIDFFTDAYFKIGILEAAKMHKGNVYIYFYDHRGQYSFLDLSNYSYNGSNKYVSHGDELMNFCFLPFNNIGNGKLNHNDTYVSRKMLNYWVNFAYKGNPNGDNELWKPMKGNKFQYLHISTFNDEMKEDLGGPTYELWTKLNIIRPLPPPIQIKSTVKNEL